MQTFSMGKSGAAGLQGGPTGQPVGQASKAENASASESSRMAYK